MKKAFIVLVVLMVVHSGFFSVLAYPSDTLNMTSQGKISGLMVQNVGQGYGPDSDYIDAEVIVKLDSQKGMSFGFQLRDDSDLPVHRGMLDLLRDAFKSNATVVLNYDIVSGNKNGVIWRIWLSK